MRYVNYSVDSGVAHIDVRRCHINLCSQSLRTVGEFAVLHALEELEVFLNASIAVRAVLSGLGKGASVFTHLVCVKVADVSLAVLYKLDCILIALVKIIGAVENATGRLTAKPGEVLENALNVLVILFGRVGIVVTKVEKTAVFFCGHSVNPYSLRRSDMKIAVRLGRESRMNLKLGILCEIRIDYVVNKIVS